MAAPLIVVMGVSGVGKTLIGTQVAQALGVEYADADAFHPQANVDKMAAGTPLTDDDRWPWLDAIGAWLDEHRVDGGVVSCSALRRVYRDRLRDHGDPVFLHLEADAATIRDRMEHRRHFMPASLLDSQLATLEPLEPDERGLVVDAGQPAGDVVTSFLAGFGAFR